MAEAMSRSFEDVLQRAEQLIGHSAEFERRSQAGPSASPAATTAAGPSRAWLPTEPLASDPGVGERWRGGGGGGGGGGRRSPDIDEVHHLSRALHLGGGYIDGHTTRSLDETPLQGSPKVDKNPLLSALDGDWPPEKPPKASPWASQHGAVPALDVRTALSAGSTPTFTNPQAAARPSSEHLSPGTLAPQVERSGVEARSEHDETRSGAEVAVLIDGLERENTLLRQQVDRCLARERALRQDAADLRNQLSDQEIAAKRKQEVEQASLLTAFQRQGEGLELASSRLEVLQRSKSGLEQEFAALRAEVSMAQAEMDKLVADLQGLLLFVLPSSKVANNKPDESSAFPLQGSMSMARKCVRSLRLACEAKFDTFGQLQGQMRQRLEEAMAGQSLFSMTQPGIAGAQAWARIGAAHSATEGAAAAAAQAAESVQFAHSAWVEEEAKLRCELRQVRQELSEASHESKKVTQQLQAQGGENATLAKELQDVKQELRIRERELKEMQLLGKYFPNRTRPLEPSEVKVANLAEELRTRCEGLERELKVARADQDLRRLEQQRGGGGDSQERRVA